MKRAFRVGDVAVYNSGGGTYFYAKITKIEGGSVFGGWCRGLENFKKGLIQTTCSLNSNSLKLFKLKIPTQFKIVGGKKDENI